MATRISINVLRSARYRREEYVGPWLPGPLIEDPYQDPQRSAELADSVSMAALLLLERLSPPFWKAPGPELLEPALHTAAGLDDPGIAVMLLRPFAVEWLTPAHAGGLAALAARYGEPWHRNLLDAWSGSRNTWRYTGDVDRKSWAGALPGLTAALRDAGATATAGWLLAASWGWLGDDIRLWLRYPSPVTRRKQLAELGKPLAGLLAAADGTALAGEIVAVLREHGDDVLACLLPMLRAAGPGPGAPLEELARDCERRLTAITERPARAGAGARPAASSNTSGTAPSPSSAP